MASRTRFAPIGVLMCVIAVIAGMIMGACPAFACTAVYVGKDASADGTTIIAKSNDYQAVWPNYVEVTERVENEPGRAMPIDNGKTVLAPPPRHHLPLHVNAMDGQRHRHQRSRPRRDGLRQ